MNIGILGHYRSDYSRSTTELLAIWKDRQSVPRIGDTLSITSTRYLVYQAPAKPVKVVDVCWAEPETPFRVTPGVPEPYDVAVYTRPLRWWRWE